MITDNKTNKIYLSGLLPEKFTRFYNEFYKVLMENGITLELLPHTNDIWAKDYMPVQVSESEFIRFKYDPDYLLPEPYPASKTDSKLVCDAIGLKYSDSSINLDGGNVVRTNKKVIMCDKIINENKHISKAELERQIIELFQIEELIFVPWEGEKIDFAGHADGMVRFIDDHTVFINDYDYHQNPLKKALKDANLEWVPLPCDSLKNYNSAVGYYINFLQMEQAIIMPTFKRKDPEKALDILEDAFPKKLIVTVESDEIAKWGGVLNCISWNVKL